MEIVDNLLNALKKIAALEANSNSEPEAMGKALDAALKIAGDAVKVYEGSTDSFATESEIDKAKELHQTSEIEIDSGAFASRADDGMWVSAWVWLGGVGGSDCDSVEEDEKATVPVVEAPARGSLVQVPFSDVKKEIAQRDAKQAKTAAELKALLKVGMEVFLENGLHEIKVRAKVTAITDTDFSVKHGARQTKTPFATAWFVKTEGELLILGDSDHSYAHVV